MEKKGKMQFTEGKRRNKKQKKKASLTPAIHNYTNSSFHLFLKEKGVD